MTRVHSRTLITASVVALALALGGTAGAEAQTTDWNYDLAVYGWLPTLSGKLNVEIPEIGDEIEVDPKTLLDDLQFTAMLAFRANHGKWSILGDVIYLKEAASEGVPLDEVPGLTLDADFEMSAWVLTFGGSYEVAQSERSSFGVLAGARYFSSDTRLDLSLDGPIVAERSARSTAKVWNAVVGVRGHAGLSERWFIPYHLDFGAGDSDFTWQAMAGIGYGWSWGSLVLDYRHLEFDQGSSGAVRNLKMSGVELGIVFHF